MYGARISPDELAQSAGQGWLTKLNYPAGDKWDGYSIIQGKLLDFTDLLTKLFPFRHYDRAYE
jgi:hypothetical protein